LPGGRSNGILENMASLVMDLSNGKRRWRGQTPGIALQTRGIFRGGFMSSNPLRIVLSFVEYYCMVIVKVIGLCGF